MVFLLVLVAVLAVVLTAVVLAAYNFTCDQLKASIDREERLESQLAAARAKWAEAVRHVSNN